MSVLASPLALTQWALAIVFPFNPGYLVIAVIAVLLAFSWRRARHGESSVPAARWRRTDEVFKDPSTGRIIRVYVDPADGSRHYIPEQQDVSEASRGGDEASRSDT